MQMTDYLTEAFLRIKERWSGRTTGDSASAEDALQESFIRLWGRYSLHSEKEAEALLSRTVRNAAVDSYRLRKTVPLKTDIIDRDDGAKEREELFLQVERLIDKHLNDSQRYILRRHHYEGASLKQVARELGMTEPAVRMQLSRARKTIRDRYHEQELL